MDALKLIKAAVPPATLMIALAVPGLGVAGQDEGRYITATDVASRPARATLLPTGLDRPGFEQAFRAASYTAYRMYKDRPETEQHAAYLRYRKGTRDVDELYLSLFDPALGSKR